MCHRSAEAGTGSRVDARIDIVRRAEELLEPRLASMGYELVACDWRTVNGRPTLQVYIDAEGGVVIRDCLKVNSLVGDLLDVEDFIGGRYHLEISSPGLDRPLRKPADFARFQGKRVKVLTYEEIGGRRAFHGDVVAVDDGIVTVDVDGTPFQVPVAAMKRANLVHEFETPPGRGRKGRDRRTRRSQNR